MLFAYWAAPALLHSFPNFELVLMLLSAQSLQVEQQTDVATLSCRTLMIHYTPENKHIGGQNLCRNARTPGSKVASQGKTVGNEPFQLP